MTIDTPLAEILTPREIEVLVLIGGERVGYKTAARRLTHRFDDDRHLSHRSVEKYARDIYERLDGSGKPREFLIELYGRYREELET